MLNIPVERFRGFQKTVASKAFIGDLFEKPIRRVAGVDVAYNGLKAYTAIVVLKLPSFKVVEEKVCKGKPPIPYIPGLLSFREGPLILRALKNVEEDFQVLIVDGHGIAHPLRCGLATYVGVLSGKPTVGVAKSLLVGRVNGEPERPLQHKPIMLNGNAVGYCLKPRSPAKPIYVSPGNFVSVKGALDVAVKSLGNHRMPEPLRLAHLAANEAKRRPLFSSGAS